MRILIANVFPREITGSQTHMDLLKRELEERGHVVMMLQLAVPPALINVFRVALGGKGSFPPHYRQRARFFELCKYRLLPYLVDRLARIVVPVFKPDIVAAQDPIIALSIARAAPRLPIVQTLHGSLYEHAKELGEDSVATLDRLAALEVESFTVSRHIIAVDTGQARLAE